MAKSFTDKLDRETYRKIKAMDRQTLNNFIDHVYAQGIEDSEAHSVDYDALKADLANINGIGEKRLDEIMKVIDKHISAEQ